MEQDKKTEEEAVDELFEGVSAHSDMEIALVLLEQGTANGAKKAAELLGELVLDADPAKSADALFHLARARAALGDAKAARAALRQRGIDDEKARVLLGRLEAGRTRHSDAVLGGVVIGLSLVTLVALGAWLTRRSQ